jgi:hypothetical protein
MNVAVSSNWAEAMQAERQAFNRISDASSQADWLKAWETWASALRRLRQQARRPELAAEPEAEFKFQSDQSVLDRT